MKKLKLLLVCLVTSFASLSFSGMYTQDCRSFIQRNFHPVPRVIHDMCEHADSKHVLTCLQTLGSAMNGMTVNMNVAINSFGSCHLYDTELKIETLKDFIQLSTPRLDARMIYVLGLIRTNEQAQCVLGLIPDDPYISAIPPFNYFAQKCLGLTVSF